MPSQVKYILWITGIFLFATLDAAEVSGTVALIDKTPRRRLTQRYRASGDVTMGESPKPVAVVYLISKGDHVPLDPPTEPLLLIQQGLQFIPSVLPVMVGTPVEFPNKDKTYHNVFSYSDTKRFDLGRYKMGEDPPLVIFDKPGEVKVFCEIHGHMRATILVLETPYFTVSDENGKYELKAIPSGDYSLHFWRISQKEVVRDVTIEENAMLTIDLHHKK